MPRNTPATEALYAADVHLAGDTGLPDAEQIDAAIRAGFPDFDPDRHAVAIADAGPHPADAGARVARVTVSAAPPAE